MTQPAAMTSKSAKVLLVVDDEFLIRWSFRSHLTAAGYTVIEAASLAAARTALGGHIDVVLLDLTLPDGSGMDLLDELRCQDCGLPVIMISAHATREVADTALANGAFRFLHKPFELDAVSRAVDQASTP